ncbi:MAG: MvaI/BcnI family restriction endonuclease [Pseudomonadota bacterium]
MLSQSDFPLAEAAHVFNTYGVEASYLVPTAMGLQKSIMDATGPFRAYLKSKSTHDYAMQGKGPDSKIVLPAFFVTKSNLLPTTASLYRPKTKSGDPRIWFSKLTSYASPNNLLGVISHEDKLYVVNISDINIRSSAQDPHSALGKLLAMISSSQAAVASELLEKIRAIASKGWIASVGAGDMGIGATLEYQLGIKTNSSKSPDYKGIEIKAKRMGGLRPRTRSNLFAQVPDWQVSKLKSSAQILDTYGYFRGSIKKLYCTVRTAAPNSQGLILAVNELKDELHELHQSVDARENVAIWKFDVLRKRLLTKHNETFWVGAESCFKSGVEHFQYKKVIHTRQPFATNFHTLCHEGIISMDHLIKRDEDGSVGEKGPLFKIHESNLGALFPPPLTYDLV